MTDQPVILPPSYLRLLLLILRMAQDGERITQRSLARAEGARFPSYVIIRLKRLRELGLVTFKDGERGTIRPSCYARFYPEALTAGGEDPAADPDERLRWEELTDGQRPVD